MLKSHKLVTWTPRYSLFYSTVNSTVYRTVDSVMYIVISYVFRCQMKEKIRYRPPELIYEKELEVDPWKKCILYSVQDNV